MEAAIAIATIALEKVRTLENVFNLAISINATVARFVGMYANMPFVAHRWLHTWIARFDLPIQSREALVVLQIQKIHRTAL